MRNVNSIIIFVAGVILMLVGVFGMPSWTGVDFGGFTAYATDSVKGIGWTLALTGGLFIAFLYLCRFEESRRTVLGMLTGGTITIGSGLIALLIGIPNLFMLYPMILGILIFGSSLIQHMDKDYKPDDRR